MNSAENKNTKLVMLVILLVLAAIISYIDRGSLGIAMPVLSKDFNLTPSQKGWLLSAFSWSYALCHIPAGYLIDRFGVFWIFAGAFALWSIATLTTGYVDTIAALFVLRLLLGVGESVMFPSFAKIISSNFAPESRGLPNSLLDAGTKIGPALGLFVGGLLVAEFGWRMMFIVLGAISLAWLLPWLIWAPRRDTISAEATAVADLQAPGFIDILKCRDAWGTFIGASCYTYAYFFLLNWLPSYLVDVRHLSLKEMAALGSLPFLAAAVAAVIAGWLSDKLIQSGKSATVVRKSVVSFGLLLSMATLPAAVVPDVQQSIWLLVVAYIAFGIFASNLWTISQTLAGPVAAGKWAGLQNCLGASMGIFAPIITGYIIEGTGSYYLAFFLAAAMGLAGTLSYLFIVGPIKPVDWAARMKAT